MKKAKKIVSVLCAAAVAAGALSGCAGSGSSQAAQSGTASGAASTAASKSGGTETITWWTIGDQPADLEAGLAAINKYSEEKIGVKIDLKIAGWDAWADKMNTIVNSGDSFDMMFTNNTNYSRFANLGAFADITDLAKSASPELYKFIPEKVWKGTEVNGKVYAVPTYKDSSITQYWAWDDKYVKKYNIDTKSIKTMKDLDTPLRKMKQGEGNSFYPLHLDKSNGFSGMFNEYDSLGTGLPILGVKIDDKSRKVVNTLEQSDIKEKFNLLHSWYKDGIINQDASTVGDAPKNKAFMSAQGFPGAEVAWAQKEGVSKYDSVQVSDPLYTTESIQGSMNAISANSQHKEACLKLLQLINTDSYMRDLMAYGVPDKDWSYTDSSKNVVKIPENKQWTLPAYSQGTFFVLSPISPNPANQYDEVKKLNEKATESACLGFSIDISNLTNEMANCNTIWEKYKTELWTGASDPNTVIPQLTAELKQNGFDKIMQEAQKQLDAQK